MKLKFNTLFSSVVFLCASAAAFSQTLKWSSQGDLITLDPHSQNEILSNSINAQVYETLTTRERDLALAPLLAVRWEQRGPMTWRVYLRSNVKFHDGSNFVADDVVFSVNRAKDSSSAIQAYANAVGRVLKVDDLTLDFELPKVNPVFLEHLSTLPIMSKAWAEKNNAIKPRDNKNQEEKYTVLNANGTGPYILVSRQPDVQTKFRRNPNWWGKFDGNVQEVHYIPIKSDAARTAALLSGAVDMVQDPNTNDLQKLRTSSGIKVLDGVENRVLFIGFDQQRDELLYSNVKGKNPFKDVRVRRAMYHSVDIESIKNKLMRGQALPTGSMSPSPLGHENDAALETRLPYDINRAKALLQEAGYADGFEVQLDCPNNRYINDEEICIALSAMWARVGIKIRLNAIPRSVYFAKGEKRDVSMYLLGWGGSFTDTEVLITPILRSPAAGGVGQWNWGNMKNATVDEAGALSSAEPDPKKRMTYIKTVLREVQEQVLYIPLHRQVIPWAMRSNVEAVHRADNWLEWRWVTIR
jgi:peptide/nickel transport system substrate-binding protein